MSASRPCAGGPCDERAAPPVDSVALASTGTRREALARLASFVGLAGLASAATSLSGCAPAAKAAPSLRVPLASLPAGGRLRVVYHGDPVELTRTGEGVTARSLLCTHQGCEVKWQASDQRYHCPCHNSVYDENGVPIIGAPTRPLAKVATRIDGNEVVVGSEGAG